MARRIVREDAIPVLLSIQQGIRKMSGEED
jgi:hypothetical protein